MLGVFYKLSEALHPRLQDALQRGQERRARRLEVTQRALDHAGELVVGFASLAVVSAAVVVLFGVAVLAIGAAALVVLGLLGFAAERLGLVDPSL